MNNLFGGNGALPLSENDVFIKFDLSEPLPAQIQLASTLLRKSQVSRFGAKVERRAHPGKWPLYLRVLDAQEQGVTYREIGEVLLSNSKREKSGYDYSPRAKVIHEAATHLTFHFPPLADDTFLGTHI